MTRRLRPFADGLMIVVIALGLSAPAAHAQRAQEGLAGLRLEDALRILQTQGLRLVYSSELVTPDMRVRAEPRARMARERLTELLQPHGLAAENGPQGVIQIVRKKRPAAAEPSRSVAPSEQPKKGDPSELDVGPPATYRERVTVMADQDERDAVSAGVDRQVSAQELNAHGGYVADDPLRVVQSLPGVATGDDFRSDYSVRGSDYRHAGVVIDGVVAPWLQHAALGRGDTGTLTMLRGDIVQEASLLVGAYPRLDGNQIGPQLNLTLREGSRAEPRFVVGASRTNATITGEGPIGSSSRGSWLVGVRRSHGEWPAGRSDETSTVFAFGDLQSKIVYDVRPGQQLSVSLVAGRSNVEHEGGDLFGFADGSNRAELVSVGWQSVFGGQSVLTQRVSSVTHDFNNRNLSSQMTSRGSNGAGAYRVDLSQPMFRGAIDAGGQIRRVRGARRGLVAGPSIIGAGVEPTPLDDLESAWIERSGHASFRRAIGGAVTFATGFRWSDSTLIDRQAVDRWLQAEWTVTPQWLVHGSTGVMHQFPALEQLAGWTDPSSLRPERAASLDVGVGHRISSSIRWDATVFVRRERDALRAPDLHARLAGGELQPSPDVGRFENRMTGDAQGIELTIARRSPTGVSGWIGYSYGVARYTDRISQETFAADFDQRQAVNASAVTALPWKARLGVTFRGGTNFPIPGYLVMRDGQLFVGSERNQERLPVYARLDVRTERTVSRWGRRFTLFAEALNLLNRVNLGPTDGAIVRQTGEAVGFTERLFPRLLTAGLRFEF